MKNFNVQIISQETIKPARPNPEPFRRHQLSFIDQIQAPIYMPFITFYAKDEDGAMTNQQKSDLMKKSLSEVLATFRPLAGRLRDNSYIECGDQGVPFIHATASCSLSDLLCNLNPSDINHLLPVKLPVAGDVPALVQITFFQCGGMAVNLAVSHTVGDAFSLLMVFNSWASIARGGQLLCTPKFDSAAHFPPRSISGYQAGQGIQNGGIVAKVFTFDADAISALREKLTDRTGGGDPKRPTRMEALSVFIWTRFMEATQPKKDRLGKRYTVAYALNLRTRMPSPSLAEDSFGNISGVIFVDQSGMGGEESDGSVKRIQEELRRIDYEYVKKLQDTDWLLESLKHKSGTVPTGEEVILCFTSLCRMPFYEGDFGWGKPEWVGSVPFVYKNFVLFFDTKTGDGVEAWVNLEDEDMKKFATDKEVLSYVSPAATV